MFHKKISYFLVLTFCFLLFLPSCSNNVDTPEQSIQRVLTTIFTCPDNEEKEYGKILNKNKYSLEQENSQTEIAEEGITSLTLILEQFGIATIFLA